MRFKLGDLPRDMREEMFNLHATSVDSDATERAFNNKSVPLLEIDISKIDVSGYPASQTNAYDPAKLPPIVIADGKLVDGGHRVASAQRRGMQRLLAIDLTGILNPAITGSIADIPTTKKPAQLDREIEAAIATKRKSHARR